MLGARLVAVAAIAVHLMTFEPACVTSALLAVQGAPGFADLHGVTAQVSATVRAAPWCQTASSASWISMLLLAVPAAAVQSTVSFDSEATRFGYWPPEHSLVTAAPDGGREHRNHRGRR